MSMLHAAAIEASKQSGSEITSTQPKSLFVLQGNSMRQNKMQSNIGEVYEFCIGWRRLRAERSFKTDADWLMVS